MARAAVVPLFTNATQAFSVDTRTFSASSGTESLLTVLGYSALQNGGRFARPEQTNTTDEAVSAVGSRKGYGWAVVAYSTEAYTLLSGGTFGMTVSYSRASTILHADRTGDLTMMVYRISSTNVLLAELGRTTTSITCTTSAQTVVMNVTLAADVAFSVGDRIYVEFHFNNTGSAVSACNLQLRTIGSASTRWTSLPGYTIQYSRALSDSAPASDALARAFAGSRPLADSLSAVGDSLTRQYTGSRALADTLPSVGDSLARRFTGARALADTAPIADTIARTFSGSRALADNAPVIDSLGRAITFRRTLTDSSPASDSLARLQIANRALADSAPVSSEVLTRVASVNRPLADSAPVVDSLARRMTYARQILDSLSEGGGTTIRRVVLFPGD